jgi:HTH-type transcriptional regulator / antitoxin HigA
MEIRPIRTEDDYKAAMREVSAFFDGETEPGSPEGDRFEVLLPLVEAYEARHFPIDLPDPVNAIKFRMEQAGLPEKATRRVSSNSPDDDAGGRLQ